MLFYRLLISAWQQRNNGAYVKPQFTVEITQTIIWINQALKYDERKGKHQHKDLRLLKRDHRHLCSSHISEATTLLYYYRLLVLFSWSSNVIGKSSP